MKRFLLEPFNFFQDCFSLEQKFSEAKQNASTLERKFQDIEKTIQDLKRRIQRTEEKLASIEKPIHESLKSLDSPSCSDCRKRKSEDEMKKKEKGV
jgi:septal ring factor EnvC (AmiA/AmiB activator)